MSIGFSGVQGEAVTKLSPKLNLVQNLNNFFWVQILIICAYSVQCFT